jgi:hypothetical protein
MGGHPGRGARRTRQTDGDKLCEDMRGPVAAARRPWGDPLHDHRWVKIISVAAQSAILVRGAGCIHPVSMSSFPSLVPG